MSDQTLTPYGIFALRASLGVMTLSHGLMKVFIFTIPGTVGYFESLGLPGVLAYLTITAEILGGLALIGGVFTRIAALGVLPVLIGATWVALRQWLGVLEPGRRLGVPRVLWHHPCRSGSARLRCLCA